MDTITRFTLCAFLFSLPLAVQGETLEQIEVFTAGTDNYHTYRIPSVIVSRKGTVLAFCEGRKNGRGDTGNIDLLLRRSFDGGRTWQSTQLIWDDQANVCGNPCPVVDQTTGTIWLLLTHNLNEDTEKKIVDGTSKGTRTCWVTKSTDDGASWSDPAEITKGVKQDNWTWYATGPGIGIQLKSGRLLIPCDNKVAQTQTRQSHVIYSDDHGTSWKLGGVAGPDCNECQAVELADGSVLLNMRSYQGNNRRMIATSRDGGESFSAPREDPALIEPVCQASMIRYEHHGQRAIVFSNPASRKRENLTVRVSKNEAESWEFSRQLHSGPAAYSCLTALPDGMLGCLYERGEQQPYETITFARFSFDWLSKED